MSVRLKICLSQAGTVSKRQMNESSWHGMSTLGIWERPLINTTLCYKEIRVSQKLRVLALKLCHKLRNGKISPRQVDRAGNKTRRRWSLLTTLTTVAEPIQHVHGAHTLLYVHRQRCSNSTTLISCTTSSHS